MLISHVQLKVLLLSQVQCLASHGLNFDDALFEVIRGILLQTSGTNISFRDLFIYRKKENLVQV